MKQNQTMTSSNTLRLFIAIPLPSEIKTALKVAMEQLKQDWPFQKWVHPEDYHLTLKFIGDVSSASVSSLETKLGQIAARSMPFGLSIKGIGTFGSPQTPSVLWAGISGNMQVLQQLQTDVEQQAAELGYAPEARAYAPHVTLARRYAGNSKDKSAQLLQTASQAIMPSGFSAEWVVDRVTLYRTHLGQSPMYETLGDYFFYAGG